MEYFQDKDKYDSDDKDTSHGESKPDETTSNLADDGDDSDCSSDNNINDNILNNSSDRQENDNILNNSSDGQDNYNILNNSSDEQDNYNILNNSSDEQESYNILNNSSDEQDNYNILNNSSDEQESYNILNNSSDGQENNISLNVRHILCYASGIAVPSKVQTFDQFYADDLITRPYNLPSKRIAMLYVTLDMHNYSSRHRRHRNLFCLGDVSFLNSQDHATEHQASPFPVTDVLDEEMELLIASLCISGFEDVSDVSLCCIPKTCNQNVLDDYFFIEMDADNNLDEDFNISSVAEFLEEISSSIPFLAARQQEYIFNPEALGVQPPRNMDAEHDGTYLACEHSEGDHNQSSITHEIYVSPSPIPLPFGEDISECEDELLEDLPISPRARPIASAISPNGRNVTRRRLFDNNKSESEE